MKNLKLITIFLLLASMILSITACTISEESKAESMGEVSSETSTGESGEESADVSETVSAAVSDDESAAVSETVSAAVSEISNDVSDAESEDESEASADEVSIYIPDMSEYVPTVNRPTESTNEKVFKILSQVADKDGDRPIISVDRYKGDKKLYHVMMVTPKEVIANAFYDEYGLTFKEAFQKYSEIDSEEKKIYKELYDDWEYVQIRYDLMPLLPQYREKMINDFIATYKISKEDIFLNDQLVCDYASFTVLYNLDGFCAYYLGLLMYLDESEAEEICKDYKKYTVTEFGWNEAYGIFKEINGTYFVTWPFQVPT